MTAAIEAVAHAKINLTLHVTGQRADGYHLLDSLVVFAELGDRITLTPDDTIRLTVDGPFAEGVPDDARNLVRRALAASDVPHRVHLTKMLPHGAGIGGGSSDAAAVLRSVGRPELAATLGADVPVCLAPVPQRMSGIGEVLAVVPDLPSLSLVLVNPGIHVPTPDVFKALVRKDHAPMPDLPAGDAQDWIGWLAMQRNDLEPPARALAPQIGDVLSALADAALARMSGSGSTCFGIYPDMAAARRAARRIASEHPGWWVQPTETIASDPAPVANRSAAVSGAPMPSRS